MLLDLLTILNTTPDTTRVLTVAVPGADLTGDVKWDQFTVTDSGASAKGTLNMVVELSPHLIPEVVDQALIRVYDHSASGGEVFRGFIRGRVPSKDPAHPSLSLIADDLSSLLDDAIIDVEWRPPETMQARIGYLWGKYAGSFLSGDLQYVLSVGGTLPAQRFALVSLRNAIEMTIAQASSSTDYYLDMLGKLHVFTSETNNAPKNVDADAPDGTEIAPENLRLEYDSNSYANRVYVSGANPVASLYVQDDAAIAAANGLVRTAILQEPSVTTAAMATSLGQMYLGRVKVAKPRGSFETSSAKVDGWRAGQNVLITSASHGLSGVSYKIARVTTRVLVPGANMKRGYSIEFGGARSGSGINGQQPLIAGQTAGIYMLDQLGNSIVSAAASASAGGLGAAVRRYIMSGVYNGDFYAPPPGPDAPISDTTNPLPYWSFVQSSGTAVTALIQLDSAQASGKSLLLSMVAGAAGDEGYIEQIVPVNGARGRSFAYRFFVGYVGQGVTSNIVLAASHQFLKNDGVTTTGPFVEFTRTLTIAASNTADMFDGNPSASNALPSDAYFLRVRVGIRRDAAPNGDSGTIVLTEARIASGGSNILIAETNLPGTYGPGLISQSSSLLNISSNGVDGAVVQLEAHDILLKPLALGDAVKVWSQRRLKFDPQGALARRTTTQSINAATWTAVALDASEDFDPFSFHSTGTNPSRFTVPTGWTGTYMLVGNSGFGNIGAFPCSIGWGLNGATPTADRSSTIPSTTAAAGGLMAITVVMELAAGDYVELMVYQGSAGAQNTFGADSGCIMYLGELV